MQQATKSLVRPANNLPARPANQPTASPTASPPAGPAKRQVGKNGAGPACKKKRTENVFNDDDDDAPVTDNPVDLTIRPLDDVNTDPTISPQAQTPTTPTASNTPAAMPASTTASTPTDLSLKRTHNGDNVDAPKEKRAKKDASSAETVSDKSSVQKNKKKQANDDAAGNKRQTASTRNRSPIALRPRKQKN